MVRLGDGTEESHRRMQPRGRPAVAVYTGELFEMDEVDRAMVERGVGVDLAALRQPWLDLVRGPWRRRR